MAKTPAETPETTGRVRLIPTNLRASESFISDLKEFAGASFSLLADIAENVPPAQPLPSFQQVEEVARRHDLDLDDTLRIASVLTFLRSRLIHEGADPVDMVEEIRAELSQHGTTLATDTAELRTVLAVSPEAKEEALAAQALLLGEAYSDSEIRPAFLPLSSKDDRLFGGFMLRLEYLTSGNRRETVTIMFTPGELTRLQEQLEAAAKQAARLRSMFEPSAEIENNDS